jgi:hypothetical protein
MLCFSQTVGEFGKAGLPVEWNTWIFRSRKPSNDFTTTTTTTTIGDTAVSLDYTKWSSVFVYCNLAAIDEKADKKKSMIQSFWRKSVH